MTTPDNGPMPDPDFLDDSIDLAYTPELAPLAGDDFDDDPEDETP